MWGVKGMVFEPERGFETNRMVHVGAHMCECGCVCPLSGNGCLHVFCHSGACGCMGVWYSWCDTCLNQSALLLLLSTNNPTGCYHVRQRSCLFYPHLGLRDFLFHQLEVPASPALRCTQFLHVASTPCGELHGVVKNTGQATPPDHRLSLYFL